jgi:hypothetical protein
MSDDIPLAPFAHESLDSVPEPKSTIAEVLRSCERDSSSGCRCDRSRSKAGDAAEHILSNIAREAPLASLLVAFLLGVAIARRR